VVLSLWKLGEEFPSFTYRMYHGTPAYGTCCSSRLIVVWWVPWYPRPCSHSTICPRPYIMGLKSRPMYWATIASKQWSYLVNPGNYLHAGMIPLCSIIGTLIRSPNSGSWEAWASWPWQFDGWASN